MIGSFVVSTYSCVSDAHLLILPVVLLERLDGAAANDRPLRQVVETVHDIVNIVEVELVAAEFSRDFRRNLGRNSSEVG